MPVADNVTMAARSRRDILFVTNDGTGRSVIWRQSIVENAIEPERLGDTTLDVVSITATDDTVVLTTSAHEVLLLDRNDNNTIHFLPAVEDKANLAVCIGDKLFRYEAGEHTNTVVSVESVPVIVARGTGDESAAHAAVTTAPSVTAAPAVTPRATATVRPTSTPRPTARPTADDESIHYGDRGDAVKKMQRRLIELGYPLDRADGVYGENTLIAVKLFQSQIGYRERGTVVEGAQDILYSRKAPVYDACIPLKQGNTGIRVKLLQEALVFYGYNPGTVDGNYGAKTVKAVKKFQRDYGLKKTGEADRETLMLLFSEEVITPKPVKPTDPPKPTPIIPDEPDPESSPVSTDTPTPGPDPEPEVTPIIPEKSEPETTTDGNSGTDTGADTGNEE